MTNNYIVGTVTDTSRKSYALQDHRLELIPNTSLKTFQSPMLNISLIGVVNLTRWFGEYPKLCDSKVCLELTRF